MAQMDARLILAGQTPDIMGSFARGQAMRAQADEFGRQNALADLYRQRGAGILAGDQNALNALAQFDPSAAMGVQQGRQQMQMNDQRMRMADEELAITRENARLRGAELAAQMDARQAQQTAAELERAIAMGTQAQSPEQWDALMGQLGGEAAQFIGQFAQRDMIIAGAVGLAEAMKMGPQEQFRAASAEEAAGYGAQAGQFGPDGRFYAINPPSGMTVETGPDGTTRIAQGPGVGGRPLTEGQSKDNVFSTRAEGALRTLEPVADALVSRGEALAESVPLGLGRELQTDDYQVARQAGDEFLQAILRKDTGAAITTQEQELYGKTYLPQPGDSPAVLEAKRQSRARALAALQAGMSAEQVAMTERALVEAARRTGGGSSPQTAMPQQGEIMDGFRFRGGDPADPNSWEQVR